MVNIVKTPIPTGYATQFLLATYKAGIFISTSIHYFSVYATNTLKWLGKEGFLTQCIEHHPISLQLGLNNPTALLLQLTPKGVSYVQENFLKILTTLQTHHIYPILKTDDRIRVKETLVNTDQIKYVRKPHTDLPAGVYALKQVDRFSLFMVDDNNTQKYRVHMFKAKDQIRPVFPTELNAQEEMTKRFGLINVKTLTKNLTKHVKDNLKVVMLISELFNSSVSTGRVEE